MTRNDHEDENLAATHLVASLCVVGPKAWLITEENTSTLSIISGRDESIFKANVGWVLVDDLSTYPRFKIIPRHTFNDAHPELKVEKYSR